MIYDVMIVGQGLAGSLLALELLDAGCSVVVVDDQGGMSRCSRVSTGLINPITGMRMAKTPDVDVLLPFAKARYAELEARWGTPLFLEKEIWRMFRSDQEQTQWLRRLQEKAYTPYMGDVEENGGVAIRAPYGLGVIWGGGCLNVGAFLGLAEQYVDGKAASIFGTVHGEALKEIPGGVVWNEVEARCVIFCEGPAGRTNPFFNPKGFNLVKGELLTVRSDVVLDRVLIGGVHVVPVERGLFRVGATYDRDRLDEVATEEGYRELEKAWNEWVVKPFECVKHEAGIRPASRDRKPLIGWSDQMPLVGRFNGFGSKAALMVPWHAERFTIEILSKLG